MANGMSSVLYSPAGSAVAAGPGGVFQGGGGSPMIFLFLCGLAATCAKLLNRFHGEKLLISSGVGLPETTPLPPGHGPPEVPTDVGSLHFKP